MVAQLANAVVSAAGTLFVFGFSTLMVTSVLTNTVKSVIRLRQVREAVDTGWLVCDCLKTKRV